MTDGVDTEFLKECLADPETTAWDCPCCGWVNYKAIYTRDGAECVMCGLECDSCGFDASTYGPAVIEEGPRVISVGDYQ